MVVAVEVEQDAHESPQSNIKLHQRPGNGIRRKCCAPLFYFPVYGWAVDDDRPADRCTIVHV